MELTYKTARKMMEVLPDNFTDVVGAYGEPGYRTSQEGGLIVLGDFWCRCANGPESDADKSRPLHGLDHHYPRLFAAMDAAGWELEWSDEWYVDYENDKCYRTSGDSYGWEPSAIFSPAIEEMITPDDDISLWIDAVVNNPRMCIPSHVWTNAELEACGFTERECGFAAGWYPGQNDDPEEITDAIRRDHPEITDILFKLSGVGQFDVHFCVFTRTMLECPTDPEESDIIGCGETFPYDSENDDGMVDCPHCGICFTPWENVAEPAPSYA